MQPLPLMGQFMRTTLNINGTLSISGSNVANVSGSWDATGGVFSPN